MESILKDIKKRNQGINLNTERLEIIEQGKKNFRVYCNHMNPDFFSYERPFQDILCNTMQQMYEKELINEKTGKPYDILIINLPPGHGKSYTAMMFSTWAFGKNKLNQIISTSYNQTLSTRFAKGVREHIEDKETYGDDNSYVVNSFFPNVHIKRGDGAMDLWSLEGSYMSYLATSFNGSITGMRGNIGIIDDPIKNKYEAVNEKVKDDHWDWYKNTFTSRMLEGALQIIIMTRWASDDLAGRLLKKFPDRCYELKMPVLNKDGEPLCRQILSKEAIADKKDGIDNDIFHANYMQEPIDKKGALYKRFKTYDMVDKDKFTDVIAYIDTADEGTDFLCCIVAGVIERYAYVLDVYYTDEPMEVTEKETARILNLHRVRNSIFESNNGGRGFARNVRKILRKIKNFITNVFWFHQSKNKRTRIIVNSSNVMEQVIMPEDWETRFELYARDMLKYQRKGKNPHDDAPDATTGIVEVINGDVKIKKKAKVIKRSKLGL
ncbi:phage terminase large subunit [Vallitalea guaymasensis]|uniref:phage terminase large subunit n=1 Tax=Vallitalea guaymasensis TaxID=1185412 RepID=UPI000DE28D82|nr:phage terminase large subunit [Vallitalea guaymasensis]